MIIFPFAKLTDGKITLRPFEFDDEQELRGAIRDARMFPLLPPDFGLAAKL